MSNDRSDDYHRYLKFDGDEDFWDEWSDKTLSTAKSKGFRLVYASDTKPCSDAEYAVSTDKEERRIYENNDKAYQLLMTCCTGLPYRLVKTAKTKKHIDGDAFKAWTNLCHRYAPNEVSNMVQLHSRFNNCCLETPTSDPDVWFVELDIICKRMSEVDPTYEKREQEITSHIIDRLPEAYDNLLPVIEDNDLSLHVIQQKIRNFWNRKLKQKKNSKEIALYATKFKGKCRNCGKQGHKSVDCRVSSNVSGNKGSKDEDGEEKGMKCFNCNKYAGHIAKDCPEKKKEKGGEEKKETGMFVGMCEFIETNEEVFEQTYRKDYDPMTTNDAEPSEFCASSDGTELWLADTGATSHITTNDRLMFNVENVSVRVIVGDGKEVVCTKRGDVLLNGEKGETLLLQRVLYAPRFHKNIFCVGAFVKKDDYEVQISGQSLRLTRKSAQAHIDFRSETNGVLYYFRGKRAIGEASHAAMTTSTVTNKDDNTTPDNKTTNQKLEKIDINDAHDRFGHIGEAALRATLKTINFQATGVLKSCEGCAMAKAKTKAIPKTAQNRAEKPGERLCADISGPYKKSIIGSNYWILIVDEFSGKAWSFFTKTKTDISKVTDNLVSTLKASSIITKFLRCDNAGENVKGLKDVCNKHGIQIEFTAPYTPQQNGMVERKFVTIRDRSMAAMFKAKFSDESQGLLWAESADTHTRLTNIVCNSRDIKCPDWKFYGTQPSIYKNLVQFGRVGYVTLGTKPAKLDKEAVKCVMIGYSKDHPGDTYRMYNAETKKVINSRNIRWADWHGPASPTDSMTGYDSDTVGIDDSMEPHDTDEEKPDDKIKNDPDTESTISKYSDSEAGGGKTNEVEIVTSKPKTSKLDREIKKLEWTTTTTPPSGKRNENNDSKNKNDDEDENKIVEVHYIYTTIVAPDPGEPRKFKNEMSGTEKDLLVMGTKKKSGDFGKGGVWKKVLQAVPEEKKQMSNRWMFKKKTKTDKTVCYKSHWCAVERLLGFLWNDFENRKFKMRPPMELRVHDVVDSSFTDNNGAIFLSGNKQVGGRTKHIDTRYHFIREKVENGSIKVSYVNSVKNPSDLLSKNVTQKIHDTHAFNMRNGTLDCWNRESVKM